MAFELRVTAADPTGITMSTGQRISWVLMREAANQVNIPCVPHDVARQMDPEGATLEDGYQEFLRQARVLCPPAPRQYHDPCDHAAAVCRPMTVYLDADEVREEAAEIRRRHALNAEIDALRR